jgi:hypothetical protein
MIPWNHAKGILAVAAGKPDQAAFKAASPACERAAQRNTA